MMQVYVMDKSDGWSFDDGLYWMEMCLNWRCLRNTRQRQKEEMNKEIETKSQIPNSSQSKYLFISSQQEKCAFEQLCICLVIIFW